jgi:hypothetical protein
MIGWPRMLSTAKSLFVRASTEGTLPRSDAVRRDAATVGRYLTPHRASRLTGSSSVRERAWAVAAANYSNTRHNSVALTTTH